MRFLTVLFVCVMIAGCTGAASPKSTAGSTVVPPAPSATVTADTGSIAGTVTDDQAAPIAGADVAVGGLPNGTAKSDALGAFTFNGLAPGDYTVTTQKLGYESAAKRATVSAGQPTKVLFSLRSIAVDSEPHSEFKEYNGFIDGPELYTPAVTFRATQTIPVNMTKGAQDMVMSMAWVANAPTTARYMIMSTSYGPKNQTYGHSPLTMKIADLEVAKAKDHADVNWNLDFACYLDTNYPFCIAANPEAVIPVVAYQQKVTHYSTVFYNEAAPEGYTGLPS